MFNFNAESNLSFDDWADEEGDGEGHKSNMTFEEWIDDEISEHGDVPLSQFEEDELKEPEHKGSESFEADYNDRGQKLCPRCRLSGYERPIYADGLCVPCIEELEDEGEEFRQRYGAEIVEQLDAESENWQEEEIDWDAKDKEQEEEDIFEEVEWEAEGKKINKTLVGLLGIGALGAILAPQQIKALFKKLNN